MTDRIDRPDETSELPPCTEPGRWPLDAEEGKTDEEIDAFVEHAETCELHAALLERWAEDWLIQARRFRFQNREFSREVSRTVRQIRERRLRLDL